MFSNFGFGEIAVLALFGLLIFGPDKLPKAAADAARVIRQLRAMATSTVGEFKKDLGPDLADLDLRAMHPRRLIQDHLFNEQPPAAEPGPAPAAEPADVTPPASGPRRRPLRPQASGQRRFSSTSIGPVGKNSRKPGS